MFCNRLRSLRESKGLNMKQFAFELGIPYTTYYNYETGAREVSSDILILLSEYFNVSVDYLLGVTDIKEKIDRLIENYPTPHEQEVITAYRSQPKMQEPVDRLLGIYKEENQPGNEDGMKKAKKHIIIDANLAAYGGGLHKAPSPPVDEHHKKVADELEFEGD